MRPIASVLVLVVGCTPLRPLDRPADGGSQENDVGRVIDAGRASDSGPMPDTSVDAPAPPMSDAWAPDAWAPDAWAPPTDAARDAWAPDAWAPDAFTFDAGSPVRPTEFGDVVLSELMIDPGRTFPFGDAEEWLELHNPSRLQAYDLTGCDLRGMSSSFTIGSVVVPPGGYVVLAQGPKVGLDPDWIYPSAYALRDTTDRVEISCGAESIDVVSYDARMFGVIEGRSIEVRPEILAGSRPELDNDRSTSWCTAIDTSVYASGLRGTPGDPNRCGTP